MTSSVASRDAAPEGARRRLVRAALDVIGAEGIAGLTNRRITQAAGVSPGTLTYHFPAQEQLLVEALETFVSEEVDRLEVISSQLVGARLDVASAAEFARKAIEESVTRREQIAQFELYLHAARNPRASAAAARCYAAYDALSIATLSALGSRHPEQHARALVALVEGIELRRLATGESTTGLPYVLELVVRAMVDG